MEHHPKYGGVAGYGTGHKGHDYGPSYVSPSQAYPAKTAGYGAGPCHTGVLGYGGYNPFKTAAFVLVLFILLVIILRAWC